MHQGVRIIRLDDVPKSVKKFFESLGDEPAVIEHKDQAVFVVRPVASPIARDPGLLAGQVLRDVEGAWSDIPQDVLEEMSAGR